MKVLTVSYGRTKSKNFQGERMELTASVAVDEQWTDVLDTLKGMVAAELFPEELAEIDELEQQIKDRRRGLGVSR